MTISQLIAILETKAISVDNMIFVLYVQKRKNVIVVLGKSKIKKPSQTVVYSLPELHSYLKNKVYQIVPIP